MPNIATVIKSEINRLARKQVREESGPLKNAVAQQRTDIAGLKRRIAVLEGLVKKFAKAGRSDPVAARSQDPAQPDSSGSRFSSKGLASNRARLELSAADFGLLVGASGQSIYAWEAGKATPRPSALAAIAALRGVGKRAAARRLAELKDK